MTTKTTERFVAKHQPHKSDATAKGWIVGDRWFMRVISRHASQEGAEYAARYWNRAWNRTGKQSA